MAEKIADASAYVRQKRPGIPTVLNLYWQSPRMPRNGPCSIGSGPISPRPREKISMSSSSRSIWKTPRWGWLLIRLWRHSIPNSLNSASDWENWITGRPTPRKTGGILIRTIPPPRPAVRWPPSITPLRWAILSVSAVSSGGILLKSWFRTSYCRPPCVPWSRPWKILPFLPVLRYPGRKI